MSVSLHAAAPDSPYKAGDAGLSPSRCYCSSIKLQFLLARRFNQRECGYHASRGRCASAGILAAQLLDPAAMSKKAEASS
jgi:hypothetical protein